MPGALLQTGHCAIECAFILWSGWKSRDSVPKLVADYMAGQLKVNEFVSHNLGLDKINEAFDLLHSGERYVHSR